MDDSALQPILAGVARHALTTVGGALVGGALVAAVAPVVLPLVGLSVLVGAFTPVVGSAIGAWFGFKAGGKPVA